MSDEKTDLPDGLVQDDQMGGDTRLKQRRIRVYDLWIRVRDGETVDDILEEWDSLDRDEVEVALEYAWNHEGEMWKTEYEQQAEYHDAQAEAYRRGVEWMGSECPRCGDGVLLHCDIGPPTLYECDSCGQQTFVDRRGEFVPVGDDLESED